MTLATLVARRKVALCQIASKIFNRRFVKVKKTLQLAPLYPLLYKILKRAFPKCLWAGDGSERALALTFDDGPHPQYTPQLLEVLERYKITASFFWLGVSVERWPQIAKEVYQRGHWIGLHGWNHRSFPLLSDTQLRQSLEKTQEAIAAACDLDLQQVRRTVRDVRPPNGLFVARTLKRLREWNYRTVMWSVVPEDWVRPGVSVVCQRLRQQVQPGSLIVLHDGYYGGEDVAATVAEAIPWLLEQGYEFVSVERLWQSFPANFSS